MSTIKADAVQSKSSNTDLVISADGSGVVDIEAGFKVGGVAGVPLASIRGDAIDGTKIANDSIDSQHYAAGSIDNEHIADNAVGLAEMASGTDGQIITYDASGDPAAVGPGTDGQVLTSTGAGSPPAFEDAGGGSWVTRYSAAFSASSSISWVLTDVVAGPVKLIMEIHTWTADGNIQIMGKAGSAGGWVNGGQQWSLNNQVTSTASTWNLQAQDAPGKPIRYWNASAGDSSMYIIEYMFTDLTSDTFRKSGFWSTAGGASDAQDDYGSPMYHRGAVSWGTGNDDTHNGFTEFRIVPSDGAISGRYYMLQLN